MDKVIASIYGDAAVPVLSPIFAKLTDEAKLDLAMDIGNILAPVIKADESKFNDEIIADIFHSAADRLKEIAPSLSDVIDKGFDEALAPIESTVSGLESQETEDSH